MKKNIVLSLFFCLCACLGAQTEFVLLTDIHVTSGNKREAALQTIVEEINRSGVPFVVVSGDLTNRGSDRELKNVKDILDGLGMPYYAIPGNHELNWSESAGKTFVDLWGNDRFVFRRDSMLFIGFSCGPYMKMGDGHVKREDVLWLDRTLQEEAKPGMRVYVFQHYPLSDGLSNWREVTDVLRKYPVVASFCGHGHNLERLNSGGIPGVMCRATYNRQDEGPAYNIVTLAGDSVYIDEKYPGCDPVRYFAFAGGTDNSVCPEPEAEQSGPVPAGLELVFEDDATVFTGVAAGRDYLYFGNSLGEVKAVSLKNGRKAWSYATGASLFSRPVHYGSLVIVPAADGNIYAFGEKDGKVHWTLRDGKPFVADGLAADGKLYQGGHNKFYKIDISSGTPEWVFDSLQNYCQAQPALAGDRIVFGAWDTYLHCLDRESGRELWRWSNGNSQEMLSPGNCVPVVSADKVFVVAPDRYMTAVALEDGKEIWRTNAAQVRESMGQSADGERVYAKLMDGHVIAVSVVSPDYRLLWNVDAGLGYEHAPCPILEHEGIVYAGSRSGWVAAIDPAAPKVLWKYRCGHSAVNRFTVGADGNVYFSLVEGKIYRIER